MPEITPAHLTAVTLPHVASAPVATDAPAAAPGRGFGTIARHVLGAGAAAAVVGATLAGCASSSHVGTIDADYTYSTQGPYEWQPSTCWADESYYDAYGNYVPDSEPYTCSEYLPTYDWHDATGNFPLVSQDTKGFDTMSALMADKAYASDLKSKYGAIVSLDPNGKFDLGTPGADGSNVYNLHMDTAKLLDPASIALINPANGILIYGQAATAADKATLEAVNHH